MISTCRSARADLAAAVVAAVLALASVLLRQPRVLVRRRRTRR